MEKRRALVSTIWVFAFALLWMNWAPRLFPQFFPQPQPAGQVQQVADADGEKADDEAAAAATDDESADASPDAVTDDAAAEPAEPDKPVELAKHPHREIELGSLDPKSGYFMKVTVDTRGATIKTVELNDPRYTTINGKKAPLKVVGNDPAAEDQTLQTSLKTIDKQLKAFGTSLAKVEWKVVASQENEATLSYTAPDGSLEIRKRYRLNQGDTEDPDESATGYLVDFDLTVQNLGEKSQDVTYTLLGPVGLPLEDRDNSRTFVEVKAGTLDDATDPDDVTDISVTAQSLVKATDKAARMNDPDRLTVWRAPIQYIGADVQYFAALIVPKTNQLKQKYFEQARPVIVKRDGGKGEWSDLSVELTSEAVTLKPQESMEHSFQVFFGPKRSELIEPLGAGGVKALGWFSVVSLGMLSMLHFFHKTLLLPYGLAIMLLTVVVRACLFPISKKIAKNQQRMKELQPKMEEIKTKYADDKEKQAVAYREFMAKNGFNPLAGCVPMFLQLPIFLGLYRALYASVDLRNAQFLWVDNLAAPDQLFHLPFTVPIVGWTYFNLLPLLTVGLFMAQQKLFMPPPTSDEQAMQYKMMNYFTLFLGFMFYRVPAGLCVYFIVSSLWGISERKLLEKLGHTSTPPPGDKSKGEAGEADGGPGSDGGGNNDGPNAPAQKPPGFFARLMDAADQAQQQNQQHQNQNQEGNGEDRNKRKKKKGRKSKGRR